MHPSGLNRAQRRARQKELRRLGLIDPKIEGPEGWLGCANSTKEDT